MALYVNQIPFLPLETDYSKTLPELSHTEPLELLDPKTGLLRYEGWSKYPNKWLYNPKMNQAYVPLFNRHKFWNYYSLISEDYLITMAHTDLGISKGSYINIKNLKNMSAPIVQVKYEDFLGTNTHIDVEKNGEGVYSSVNYETLNMTFLRRPEDTFATIEVSAKSDIGDIQGNFTADAKGYEGIAYISSEPKDPKRHSYKYKLQQKYTGNLKLNGKNIISCTSKKPCYGILDNSRGYSGYSQKWVWTSTCFESQNHTVAFNIEMSTDNPHSSWDSVFVDGKLYKLDPHVLHRVTDDHWKYEKADSSTKNGNKLTLEFHKASTHSIGANFIFYNIDLKSNYGYFTGSIETSDNKVVKFENQFGFIEDFHARW